MSQCCRELRQNNVHAETRDDIFWTSDEVIYKYYDDLCTDLLEGHIDGVRQRRRSRRRPRWTDDLKD